jgi:hypothetical protein
MSTLRRWLVVAASLFAVGELIDGIVYQVPASIVFTVVLGLCAWWASRSPGWPPAAVLGVLPLRRPWVSVRVGGTPEYAERPLPYPRQPVPVAYGLHLARTRGSGQALGTETWPHQGLTAPAAGLASITSAMARGGA